jgi:glycosyltransferase involved in cell wall biosynthesis
MAKNRKRIGLIFSYDEGWIAGAYYIMNLIEALKILADAEQPFIEIFYNAEKDLDIIKNIQYPYIAYTYITTSEGYDSTPYPIWERVINKISLILSKKLIFDQRPKNLSFCFPNPDGYFFGNIDKKAKWYWIPDFQEDYFAYFFSQQDIAGRKAIQKKWVTMNYNLILSSQDVMADFRRLYPEAQNKVAVMPFAVTHPNYMILDIENLRKKYHIPQKYFFAPNQFWVHKNHIVVLKAIKFLKEKNIDIFVAFSGKQHDYRNITYFSDLQQYVKDNDLSENVQFLGFIDRSEQLKLMSEALAVIQPSLFEGWSTVVEDAKAMNQLVVLSNLKVHQEQISDNVLFFEPEKVENLAHHLQTVLNGDINKIVKDYTENLQKFAENFIQIATASSFI